MEICISGNSVMQGLGVYSGNWDTHKKCTLQIYTVENGTQVKRVKVTSICCPYYNVEV